jgi:hypothetical protein
MILSREELILAYKSKYDVYKRYCEELDMFHVKKVIIMGELCELVLKIREKD